MTDDTRARRHAKWAADICARFSRVTDGVEFWKLVDTVRPYRDELRQQSPDLDLRCAKAAADAFKRMTGFPLQNPGKAA